MNDAVFFGQYELLKRLAVGGMGEIFLARQLSKTGITRHVILKTLLSEDDISELQVEQFLDEARIAATLNHPNIVSLIEVGEHDGMTFIAMEYIHGLTLRQLDRLAQADGANVPYEVWAKIISDAAIGLHYAHQAQQWDGKNLNLVHRDVSPQNIMVRRDGVTKVLDFGIASASNREAKTATGLLKGKIAYMAPEQIGGSTLDGRTDQFSLGVVLWELLSGQVLRPLSESTLVNLTSAMNDEVPLLKEVDSTIDPELSRIVARMTHREPEKRFESCADVAAALTMLVKDIRNVSDREVEQAFKPFMESIESPQHESTGTGKAKMAAVYKTPGHSASTMVLGGHDSSDKGPQAPSVQVPSVQAQTPPPRLFLRLMLSGTLAVVVGAGIWLNRDAIAPLWSTFQRGSTANDQPAKPQVPPLKANLRKAILNVTSTPSEGHVYLDGLKIGETPLRKDDLEQGRTYRVKVKYVGYKSGEDSFVATREAPTNLKIKLVRYASKVGFVTLNTLPPGAEIYRAGQLLGMTPIIEMEFPAGKRLSLRAVLQGYESKVLPVRVRHNEKQTLTLHLHKKVMKLPVIKAQPQANGYLTVDTTPWTKVTIKALNRSKMTPFAKLPIAPGTYKLHFQNRMAKIDEIRSIKVRSGEKKLVRIDFSKK
jgi:serine/threonine protein kinase